MSSGCTSFASIQVQNQMASYQTANYAQQLMNHAMAYGPMQTRISDYYTVPTSGYARMDIGVTTGGTSFFCQTTPNLSNVTTYANMGGYYWGDLVTGQTMSEEAAQRFINTQMGERRIEVVDEPEPRPFVHHELVDRVFEEHEARERLRIEEETRLRREEIQLRQQQYRESEARQVAARARARNLLIETLTDEQVEQLERDDRFELRVGSSLYRISNGSRVERLHPESKRPLSLFCIHPDPLEARIPSYDIMLAQKLLLKYDEPQFLRIANETRVA